MAKTHKFDTSVEAIAFIALILISLYFAFIYGNILSSPYRISNYTGISISEVTNHSLNYILHYYNMTLHNSTNVSTSSSVNISTLHNIAANLPIPDYSQVLNSSLLIATALLAFYGLIAVEIYKRYKFPEPKKPISKMTFALLLAAPALLLLYSIYILFDGMFIFAFLQSQQAYLISTMYVHVSITNIVKAIEVTTTQVTDYVTYGTQFLEMGVLLGVFMPFMLVFMYVMSSSESEEFSNKWVEWLKKHPRWRAFLLAALIILFISLLIVIILSAWVH